jgi:phosphonatase-like hydrolase
MVKMVVFDMAGTTVDEDNVVYKTLRQAINEKGFNISLEEVLLEGAGKEKRDAIKSLLKFKVNRDETQLVSEIYQQFSMLLKNAYTHLNVLPKPNAVELFQKLKERNIKVVLNTGYNRETANELIEKLRWSKTIEFDELITSNDVKNNRPDPEMIELAMVRLGIEDPDEVIKVGDSIIDIEEGQNAGCALSIGITTGAHTYQQLASACPDHIIHDLLDLIPIINKMI